MRLAGCRLILAVATGLLCLPCRADRCEATLRVAAHRTESDSDQAILQDTAVRLSWCLIWDGRETNITRRLAMLRDGEFDLVYDAFRTDERARYAWFSDKYRDERILLYIRREDAVRYGIIHSFGDLLDSRAILVTLRNAWMGPDYGSHREALLAAQRAYEVERFAQARGMLQMHHADVFIAPDTFTAYLRSENETGIVPLDWQAYQAAVHFMFSRKTVSAGQVGQFNRALAQVLKKPPAQ